MTELLKTKAYLAKRGLEGDAEFGGCSEDELATLNLLIHPRRLPAAFQAFYRCVGRGAGQNFEYDYRFVHSDIPGHNEYFIKDHPEISSAPFNDVYVFAAYPDGYCFFYLEDIDRGGEVPVHVTYEGKILETFPNLDTFICKYLRQEFG